MAWPLAAVSAIPLASLRGKSVTGAPRTWGFCAPISA